MSKLLMELEDSVVQLESVTDLIVALDEANAEGLSEFPSTALRIPARYLRKTTNALRELVDQAFEEHKKGAEAV